MAVAMSQRKYIGVIDDDDSLCRSLARVLQHAGFQAITYTSAEEFLKDPLRVHFGCLLVDIQLGGMSGIELHRQLIGEGLVTPVIYITAHDDPRSEEEAMALGCAGFFRKMETSVTILEAIRRATEASPAR
jgi:FixJ family two-component response regulator